MPSLNQVARLFFYTATGTTGILATKGIIQRYMDDVQGNDRFSQHTRQQLHKHPITGMHAPFMPNPDQRRFFVQHFSDYSHLLPASLDALKKQQAIKTPVRIRSLATCPPISDYQVVDTLVVGGAPALLSAVPMVEKGQRLVYMHNSKSRPISANSAHHLEEDAPTEAPANYTPSHFFMNQFKRALSYQSYKSIEETGFCFWDSMDLIGWLNNPGELYTGIRVAIGSELAARSGFHKKQIRDQYIAEQCKWNEEFYEQLNKKLGGTLLAPESGSIIFARNEQEAAASHTLQADLQKTGRTLNHLSPQDMQACYGFVPPKDWQCFKKTHDRVLSPNFMKIVSEYIQRLGAEFKDAILCDVYVDGQATGGIAKYCTHDGQEHFIRFTQLILSPGNQPVLDFNDQRLYKLVAANGTSALAFVSTPESYRLPTIMVCGGTNHVVQLSRKPVIVQGQDGTSRNCYLMRLTAGATITPSVSKASTVKYDGKIAFALFTSAKQTLGPECDVEPIFVTGCNRQISENGQLTWMNPFPGIHIQYGAGGGGLTRAPDRACGPIGFDDEPSATSSHSAPGLGARS